MPSVRVVVQARMSSNRLPGKSLLPIGGIPAAILAALRVRNPRWHVVIATSDHPSDDPLVRAAEAFSVPSVRGPLDDVLGRFLIATHGLADDAVIVRLTGDNVLPDARLVGEAVDAFRQRGCAYLYTWSPALDVPYGLSVEVFRASALRQAAVHTASEADREHVTPWIWRNYGRTLHRPRALPRGYGRLRCTIDTLDDYLRVEKAFAYAPDPRAAHWIDLCRRLALDPATPRATVPAKDVGGATHGTLVLGTAQLGMAYGIANRTGAPREDEATAIVREAVAHGVTHIDTARAYGRSEGRIGQVLAQGVASGVHVVTKLVPMDEVADDSPAGQVRARVDASVFRSCRELRLHRIPTVLVHRAGDRIRWKGAAWQRLKELRHGGVIGRIGVSAERPSEVVEALADADVGHVQFPFNILDWRWQEAGIVEALARRPEAVVHVRSALLQGLLASPDPALWRRVAPDQGEGVLCALEHMRRVLGRESLLDLALAYVRGHPWLHGVVVGVERVEQLRLLVRLFCKPALTRDQIEWVERRRARVPERLLNPSLWPR